jgi:hypothetical protein
MFAAHYVVCEYAACLHIEPLIPRAHLNVGMALKLETRHALSVDCRQACEISSVLHLHMKVSKFSLQQGAQLDAPMCAEC